MNAKLGLAALVFGAAVATATAGTYEISNDPGGNIGQHDTKYAAIAARGDSIRIVGKCTSACTLVIHNFQRDKICVSPSGYLGFHIGNDGKGGPSHQATNTMMNSYPADIVAWIDAKGGLNKPYIFMRAPEIYKYFRQC